MLAMEINKQMKLKIHQDLTVSKKSMISKPQRTENQRSFDVFSNEPEIHSIQYHSDKKLLCFIENNIDTFIIGDLTTHKFMTVEKPIIWNTLENKTVFEHFLNRIIDCLLIRDL